MTRTPRNKPPLKNVHPHQVALRVDGSGVTTNAKPLSRHGARLCPWDEIEAVVSWSFLPLTWVGIIPSEGTAPEEMIQRVRPGGRTARAVVAAGLPYEVAANAVGTAGWVRQRKENCPWQTSRNFHLYFTA